MADDTQLREAFHFDDGDLKQNHLGRISQRQMKRLSWRRFFPHHWWFNWPMTLWCLLMIGLALIGIFDSSLSFGMRFFFLLFLLTCASYFWNLFAVVEWRNRHHDMHEERAECLYGRVLHLPKNSILVGERKLTTLSKQQQEAFEHNAYYMVYVAPHSGEILSAESAEKPKYND